MTSNRWEMKRSEQKVRELEQLLSDVGRRTVLLLCHNNPDPDSIAGALGMQCLLKKTFGVRSVLGYGGVISRAENKAMVQRLRIDITRLTELDASRYYGIGLIDGQPATGNNLLENRNEAPLIVIDHHPRRKYTAKAHFHDVRPQYGATSTIVTEYLLAAGVKPNRSLANALFYGIKTDTHSLIRSKTREDFRAYQYLGPLTNPRMVALIENPSLSHEHFIEYHRGLSRANLYRDISVSYLGKIGSEAIIPELADLLLRIEGVRWSLCMGRLNDLMILSLRSTSKTYGAGRVIRRLVGKNGSAGGHRDMAGGQISLEGMNKAEVDRLAGDLVRGFLKLIDREGIHAKSLVTGEPAGENVKK